MTHRLKYLNVIASGSIEEGDLYDVAVLYIFFGYVWLEKRTIVNRQSTMPRNTNVTHERNRHVPVISMFQIRRRNFLSCFEFVSNIYSKYDASRFKLTKYLLMVIEFKK